MYSSVPVQGRAVRESFSAVLTMMQLFSIVYCFFVNVQIFVTCKFFTAIAVIGISRVDPRMNNQVRKCWKHFAANFTYILFHLGVCHLVCPSHYVNDTNLKIFHFNEDSNMPFLLFDLTQKLDEIIRLGTYYSQLASLRYIFS